MPGCLCASAFLREWLKTNAFMKKEETPDSVTVVNDMYYILSYREYVYASFSEKEPEKAAAEWEYACDVVQMMCVLYINKYYQKEADEVKV